MTTSGEGTRTGDRLSRAELTAVSVIAAASLVCRTLAYFRYRFDSDEPQHLHVAWGWTAGLLQYRDLFDNHAPLFHILTAPILRAVGERADILFFMRAPMLLPWAVVLGVTFVVARRLYDLRVAVWSTLLLSLIPTFFLKSLEYRTDNLWNAFWMLALVVLTNNVGRTLQSVDGTGLRTRPTFQLFLTGLLIGLAMATSMKTGLLIITLGVAAAVTMVATQAAPSLTRAAAAAGAFLAGAAIPPAMIAAYFWWRGAWASLVYCVVTFNEAVAEMRPPLSVWVPRLAFLPLMLIALRVAWKHRHRVTDPIARWRFFFAVATAVFFVTLICFWVLISPRDFLPFLPFVTIFAVAAMRTRRLLAVAVILAALCLLVIADQADYFANGTSRYVTMLNQLLHLTRPGEPVIDYKGETVYRPRPFYYILEFITRNQIIRGRIPDTIPEDVIRDRCHVAQADGEFWPARGGAFLRANFLDVGRLRAAGQWIDGNGGFAVAVPGEYVIAGRDGEARGRLDGAPYTGARTLLSGAHRFEPEVAGQRLACFWAPAFQRGFSPFQLRDREF